MNRNLALPAAIAFSAHAIFFLLFSPPPVEGKGSPSPASPAPPPTKFEYQLEAPESEPADKGPAQRIADLVVPPSPDLSTNSDAKFQIDVPLKPYRQVDIGVDKVPRLEGNFFGGGGQGEGNGSGVFSLSALDGTPRTKFQISPEYPRSLKNTGITGEVTVEFVVDANGRVRDVQVVKASHPDFAEPTIRAISKWRFEPGRKDNVPVSFRMAVPIVFKIDE